MRVPRVYIEPNQANLSAASNSSLNLEGQTAHYLLKVLRLTVGREIILFDGQGTEAQATISSAQKNTLTVTVNQAERISKESSLYTHLGIGVSRGERFDWVLQKATELGVNEITPLLTERVEVKIKPDRADKKYAHWQQIIISACEQCQRNTLPILNDPLPIENWLESNNSARKFVLDHRGTAADLRAQKPESLSLLVGPEGGLSESEIALAIGHNFQSMQLGPRVLRTETAPITALSVLQYCWGDFG